METYKVTFFQNGFKVITHVQATSYRDAELAARAKLRESNRTIAQIADGLNVHASPIGGMAAIDE